MRAMNSTKKYINSNMGPTKFSTKHKNLFFKTQFKRMQHAKVDSFCVFEGNTFHVDYF